MNQEPYIFQEGDVVSFGGCEYTVTNTDFGGLHPLLIQNKSGCSCFTKDGRYQPDHTEPLLKLIRPAKKPKRKVQLFRYHHTTKLGDFTFCEAYEPDKDWCCGMKVIKSTLLEEFEI